MICTLKTTLTRELETKANRKIHLALCIARINPAKLPKLPKESCRFDVILIKIVTFLLQGQS